MRGRSNLHYAIDGYTPVEVKINDRYLYLKQATIWRARSHIRVPSNKRADATTRSDRGQRLPQRGPSEPYPKPEESWHPCPRSEEARNLSIRLAQTRSWLTTLYRRTESDALQSKGRLERITFKYTKYQQEGFFGYICRELARRA